MDFGLHPNKRLKTTERKHLIYTIEKSIRMNNRLKGRGHSCESWKPVRRLLKDYRQEEMA